MLMDEPAHGASQGSAANDAAGGPGDTPWPGADHCCRRREVGTWRFIILYSTF